MSTDLILGFLAGMVMHRSRLGPGAGPMGLVGPIIGIAFLILTVAVSIYLWKDLRQRNINDTSKTLWAITFFVLPISSWLAYHFVVKKG